MANKVAVAGLASILVVACVVAAVVTTTKKGDDDSSDGSPEITTSSKSVEAMCQPTPYKETCEKTLNSAKNVTEPKDLIKFAFDSTVEDIKNAIKNTDLISKASSDPYTKDALRACEELFDLAVSDLRRSAEKIETFSLTNIKDVVDDLKTWLSAVVTYEETCLDGFKRTKGDTGDQMVKVMNTTRELSSNALSILNSFGDMLTGTMGLSRRKLLSTADTHDTAAFATASSRRLLQVANAKPNVVVAKDGTGQYKTINEALKAVPQNNVAPFVIFIKAGVYQEYVDITATMTNVVLIGEGSNKTKITGGKSVKDSPSTYHTCTVGVQGGGFVAKDLWIENTAGPLKEQAVALRVSGDKTVIYNCRIDGYQDTLYTHTYRQFYRDCTITGTIDFVFGNGEAVFQNCKLIVRKPSQERAQACMVTAQGRTSTEQTGALIFQNCEIKPDADYFTTNPPAKAYLGRPWFPYSRTIIMQSFIDKFIDPEGWAPWNETDYGRNTCYYAEFQNRGPGAALDKRVNWKGYQKGFTAEAAQQFTLGAFINNHDNWLQKANVPLELGMMKL